MSPREGGGVSEGLSLTDQLPRQEPRLSFRQRAARVDQLLQLRPAAELEVEEDHAWRCMTDESTDEL